MKPSFSTSRSLISISVSVLRFECGFPPCSELKYWFASAMLAALKMNPGSTAETGKLSK
jgi:hypothetical protein